MPKFLIDYKARTPAGKWMINRRTFEASNPRAAVESFEKQIPTHEGIVRVWQEVLVAQTSKRLVAPSE